MIYNKRYIPLIFLAAAFALGCFLAKMQSVLGSTYAKNTSELKFTSHARESKRNNGSAGESWEITKERIVKDWQTSPYVSSDFPMLEKSRVTLSKISTEELETWLRKLRSDYDYEEYDTTPDLLEFVLEELGRRDPARLIKFLTDHKTEGSFSETESVIYNWIETNPKTFLAWLDNKMLPSDLWEDQVYYTKSAIERLAVLNPEEFEIKLAQVSDKMRKSILENYAYNNYKTLGKAKLLEKASTLEPHEAMAIWNGLVKRVSESNREEAYAILNQLDVSEADRASLIFDLDLNILDQDFYLHAKDFEKYDEIILAWLKKHPEHPIPAAILNSVEDWVMRDIESASDWMIHKLPESYQDAFYISSVERAAHDYQNNFSPIAKLASLIKDPSSRAKCQSQIKRKWQKKDPAAATLWEQSLPNGDQESLK